MSSSVITEKELESGYIPYRQSHISGQEQKLVWTGPVPDSDESSVEEYGGDSAIGSYASTHSVSLADSVYAYREEHGRRYHAEHPKTTYHLPNDDLELDRLDLQHHLFRMTLNGSLHRAPLAKDIHHVLDVGTGTGLWPVEFAEEYPSATVIGTDLSPVQPRFIPPNCRFYIENAEDPWNFDEKFDFIHGRMLVVGIKNWARFFEQSFAHLKPGGWIELQDLNFPARCDDDTAPSDSPLMQWSTTMMLAARNLGLNLEISNKFPSLLGAAGFTDIQSETHAWPMNRWAKDQKMKDLGMWGQHNFLQGLNGFSMAYFTRGLGWDKKQVEEFVEKVRKHVLRKGVHVYLPITFFWARKPEV